jgi:type IV secretion system protein VirB6
MFTYLLNAADAAVRQFVFGAWAAFNTSAQPWLRGLMVIFVCWIGYRLWMGQVRMSIEDLAPKLFKMVAIFVIVTHPLILDRLVYRVATDVPGEIATTMVTALGDSTADIKESLDGVFKNAHRATSRVWEASGFLDFTPIAVGVLIWVGTLVALVPVALALILSKLALGVLLGLAPFALVLYMFESTKGIWEGYLRQVLNFAIIPTLIYSLLGLVLSMMKDLSRPLADTKELPGLETVGPYLFMMLLCAALATQVLSWSSGISGGLALAASGITSKATGLARGALQATQAGARAAGNRSPGQVGGTARAFASGAARQVMGLRAPRAPGSRGRE